MNTKAILLLALLTNLFINCSSNESIETKSFIGSTINYSESLNSWKQLKKENGNSYKYSLESISWTNNGTRTEISVVDDEVVSRYYESFEITPKGKNISNSYLESKDDLGTHIIGHEAITIDELYDSCLSKYLSVNNANNSIYFETANSGIITSCGYVPKNCIDDCFFGYNLGSIEWPTRD